LTDYAYPPNTSKLDAHYERPTKGVWDLYQRKGTLTEDDWLRKRDDDEIISPDELLRKQRWVTLGYQYDWKTKVYDLEHGLSMPKELDTLAKTVVSAVEGVGDGASWCNTYPGLSFKAEAGVINYYQLRDTLMAHVDKSEVNMDAPLVSVR
jgi:alkylated DNA repair protein alkB family protein 1